MHRIIPIVSIAALTALSGVLACDAEPEVEPRAAAEPPAEITDSRGQVLKLQGPAQYEIIETDSIPTVVQEEATEPTRPLTREQLANDLRGVRLVDGHEYRVEQPDYAMADRILAGMQGRLDTLPSNAEAIDELTAQEPRGVNGSDNRIYKSNNFSYPYRPLVFSEVGCSGTMIGPHTMVTAAHCVYNTGNNSWLKVWDTAQGQERWPRFATGVDGRDANPVPNGWRQCYDVTVPGGWVSKSSNNLASASQYDYAVVDFYSRCGDRPGDQSGWLGTMVASEGTIESEGHYLYGYPQFTHGVLRYTSSPPNMEAEIWGMSRSPGQLYINSPSWQLKYNHDTSGGQSGMGTWYVEDGTGWVRLDGIHRGDAGSYNIGRRWDWTVRNFVEAYSLFPST
ncbi:MAG: trypsin-like peptidase domain-containing protein [Deltaproteobacteria bacterium]|nr:trypsin-like peptidase domain-containing protein [Deltaproteobacteria bacterium]